MMSIRASVAAAMALAAWTGPDAANPAAPAFVVVVNASNPIDGIDRDGLSRIFLKRVANWPDGRSAGPIDLPSSDPVRTEFSRAIHRKSVDAVRAYWQQQIFSGRDVPPAEKTSEADVLASVRATAAAVGYVSAGTTLPPGVKGIVVRGLDD